MALQMTVWIIAPRITIICSITTNHIIHIIPTTIRIAIAT